MSEKGEKWDMVMRMYEVNKKEIMKHVHRPNPFGQAETQIDFFEDHVEMHDHATPCRTVYDFKQPIHSLIIRWDPFLTYDHLDSIFYESIEDAKRYESLEKELNNIRGGVI